jgi:two-component system response regulator HydG
LSNYDLRRQVDILSEKLREESPNEILGDSEGVRKALEIGRIVASADTTVLIFGESGTGKELLARYIHDSSPRAKGAFITINCGAIPRELAENELFGYERGAFTGATEKIKQGKFEQANHGTILFDEISELSMELQVKLLRVLQERSFERVGGEETLTVDVRVLAATNRDLRAETAAGRFREDLFYRLFVIPLHVPALRERREDIPLLAEHFLGRLCREMGHVPVSLTEEALNLLRVYDWPGNVRELENILERAIVLCEGDRIAPADLPFETPHERLTVRAPEAFPPLRVAVEELERQMIRRALEAAGGVKVEAARLLDLKPSVLYYKLEKHGLAEPGRGD